MDIHYPHGLTFYGCEQFAAQSMLGLLAAQSQRRHGLTLLLNLHKVEKFQRYANAHGMNPRQALHREQSLHALRSELLASHRK